MALNVGELNATLNIDTSDYIKGLSAAEKAAQKWGNQTEQAANAVSGKFGAVLTAAKYAAVGFGASLFGAGIAGVKLAGDMEKTAQTFKVLLGSQEKATAMMEQLRKFAAETPFEFPEIATAAKNLLALGIAADKIPNTLKSLGDVAAGVNIPFGELADIYGKINVQGRVFAEDINQLQGRGIPIVQELAKQFGVSTERINQMVSDGKIGFPEIEKAFIGLTGQGGKFNGMMKELSTTLPGLLSTLTDNAKALLTVFGNALIKTFDLKGIIKNFSDQLEQIVKTIENVGLKKAIEDAIPESTKLIIIGIAGAITVALIPSIIAATAALYAQAVAASAAAAAFLVANAAMIPFIIAGAAVAAGAYLIYKNWEPLGDFFSGLLKTVKSYFNKYMSDIKIIGYKAAAGFLDAWLKVYGWIPGLGDRVRALRSSLDGLIEAEEEARKAINIVPFKKFEGSLFGVKEAAKMTSDMMKELKGDEKNLITATQAVTTATNKEKIAWDSASTSANNLRKVMDLGVDTAMDFAAANYKAVVTLNTLSKAAKNLGLDKISNSFSKINDGINTLKTSLSSLSGKNLSEIFGDSKSIDAFTAALGVAISALNAIKKATTSTRTLTVDLSTKFVTMGDSFRKALQPLIGTKSTLLREEGYRLLAIFTQLAEVIDKGVGEAFRSSAKAFLSGQGDLLTTLREGVKNAIIDAITDAVIQGTILKGAIGGLLSQLTEALALGTDPTAIISKIGAALPAVAKQMETLLGPLKTALTAAFPTAEIPAMADGGVVRRPTMALIGEAGPEAVVPLSQMGNMGGGQQTIIIELDGRIIGRAAVQHMPREVRIKTGLAFT